MKKTIFTFVMAAILLCSMAVCASALEDYNATLDETSGTYSYTVEYNVGTDNAGEMYGMVAVTGVTNTDEPVINESNIVYIDQATADSTGKITFTKFAPMGKTPAEEGYTESLVCIGGAGLDGATAIGTLKAVESTPVEPPVTTTYKITGTVKDSYSQALASVTVMSGETAVVSANADTAGAYDITLDAAGTYSVVFTKPGYCTFTYTGVTVDGEEALGSVDISKLIGDVNNTDEVNGPDIVALIEDFGKVVGTDTFKWAGSDTNGTGEVNGQDIVALTNGFGSVSITEAFGTAN